MTNYTNGYSAVVYVALSMNSMKIQLLLTESFVEFLGVAIKQSYFSYLYLASVMSMQNKKQFFGKPYAPTSTA